MARPTYYITSYLVSRVRVTMSAYDSNSNSEKSLSGVVQNRKVESGCGLVQLQLVKVGA